MDASFPCPCCGHLTLSEPPGSYEICSVCFWEDDQIQLRWPQWIGGANKPSLVQAQQTYAAIGACETRLLPHVRTAALDEPVEPGWRPIDLSIDCFEPEGLQDAPWPQDESVLYWWRPTFWRTAIRVVPDGAEALTVPTEPRWRFDVEDSFHINGRSTVVIGRLSGDLRNGEPAILTVGEISRKLDRVGFDLLCRAGDPERSIAFVLPDVDTSDVPPGSTVHSAT